MGQAEPGRSLRLFQAVPWPGPGLRRPVPDTVSDLHRRAPVPTALRSFLSGSDPESPAGLPEGMALSGQEDAGYSEVP